MITPSQIRERKLSTVDGDGYDRNEVNQLLVEIIESYESVYEENKELYRKMEILANRIEEYRADEDSIKTALITAQKMADKVTAQAKEKAEKAISESAASAQQTVVDAKEKADKIIGEARDYVSNLTKEKAQAADEIVSEAEKKANDAIDSAKIVAKDVLEQAKSLSAKIIDKAKAEKDYHEEIVSKLKKESKGFRESLVSLYESQLNKLRDLAEMPETETDEYESIKNVEQELNSLLSGIEEITASDDSQDNTNILEQEQTQEITDAAVTEEPEEAEIEEEETSFELQEEDKEEQVDKIIEEIESFDDTQEEAAVEAQITETDVESAIDAFSKDEITPIDESAVSIPIIEDEPEFESKQMPFESYFHVNKEDVGTDETISLIPPDEDEDDDDSSRFKGFFKKKK